MASASQAASSHARSCAPATPPRGLRLHAERVAPARGWFDTDFTRPPDQALAPAGSMSVMHARASSTATRSWPTKVATLLFSGGLASLAILYAGSPACGPATPLAPATPKPATPAVVEATKAEPLAPAPPPTATNPSATNPSALNPPPPSPPPATEKPAEDPPPRRYLGGSKSAAVFEPDLAPQTQNNAEPRGAR